MNMTRLPPPSVSAPPLAVIIPADKIKLLHETLASDGPRGRIIADNDVTEAERAADFDSGLAETQMSCEFLGAGKGII